MNIADIRKSISEMSEEELYNTLREMRASRRISKKPPSEPKTAKAKSEKKLDVMALFNTMSDADKLALISSLEGK